METLRKLPLIIAVLSVPLNAFAGGVGATRLNFLKIDPAARPSGMGGAFGSVPGNINCVGFNPAGLVYLKSAEASFTHLQWLEGIQYSWAGYAMPLNSRKVDAFDEDLQTTTVDNFDDGADPNMLGASMGTWSDRDFGGTSDIKLGYNPLSSTNEGYSLEISYKVKPLTEKKNGYAGAWIGLKNLNASKKQALYFLVKAGTGAEKFEVGLKDASGVEMKIDASRFVKLSQMWEQVVIPLTDFSGVNLSNLDNISFTFSDSGLILIDNIKFTGKNSPEKSVAVTLAHLNSGSMDHYVETDTPPYYEKKESFSATESMLSIAYARDFRIAGKKIPLGAAAKVIREKLYTYNNAALAFALDLGAMHNYGTVWGNVLLGVCLQNIGYAAPVIKYSAPMPLNTKTSIAIIPRNYNFIVDIDLDSPIDDTSKLKIGMESKLYNILSLRAGYCFGGDLGGLGTGLGISAGGFGLDYAFAPYSLFGNTHRLSLTYTFLK